MKLSTFTFILCLTVITSCSLFKNTGNTSKTSENTNTSGQQFDYRGSYSRTFDLIHTKLQVSFLQEKQQLEGIANLTLTPYFYSADSLTIDAKGMTLNEVSMVDTSGARKTLTYSYDSLQIKITLGKEYSRTDTIHLYINYVAKPNELGSKGSTAIEDDRGLYFINPLGRNKLKPIQIWTQGETEASSCWFPTIDAPNEKTTEEIFITYDSDFKTLSNGKQISSVDNGNGTNTDYWKQELPHAPYLFTMIIGDFSVVKHTWDGIPVNYYVEPKDSLCAELVFGNTPEMLTFFSEKLGVKYPWDKFSQIIVKDYVSGAMENTSATIYGSFVLRDKRQLLDRNHEDIVAHELFHHWFGDLVTCESWSNLSLNESFASYGEYLWIEHKYGKLHADRHLWYDHLRYMTDKPWKPIINYHFEDKEDMFNRHSYEKGSLVLHQLRQVVGDDAFFASLKLYLERNKFKTAEVHNLRMAFEEVTGTDMNWYFNQWFLKKGHPILDFSYKVKSDSLIVDVVQTQVADGIQSFYLPLHVNIHSNGEVVQKEMIVTQPKQQFIYTFNDDISWVNIDPNDGLCGEVNQIHTAEQALYVFKNNKHYKDKRLALLSVKKDSSDVAWDLLNTATKDSLEVFRRLGIHLMGDRPDNKSDNFKAMLKDMATTDTMSLVRADAIKELSEQFPDDSLLIPLYKKGLEDLSYEVNVQSITALFEIKREDALLRAIELEKEEDPRLLYTLCKLYSDLDDESKLKFYVHTAQITEGYYKEAILGKFQKYLADKSHEFVWKGFKAIKEIAIYDNDKDVRAEAGLVLHELHKLHLIRIEDIEKDIADKKKSTRGKDHDLRMLQEKHVELLEKEAKIQKLINEVINAEKNIAVKEIWDTAEFILETIVEIPEPVAPIGTDPKKEVQEKLDGDK